MIIFQWHYLPYFRNLRWSTVIWVVGHYKHWWVAFVGHMPLHYTYIFQGMQAIHQQTKKNSTQIAQTPQTEKLMSYTTRAIRRSVPRHCLRYTAVKLCMVFRSRPNVLPNDARVSQSGHMTNRLCSSNSKLRSKKWKHFFGISDRDHIQNLTCERAR